MSTATPTAASSSMVPSTQRPIPLKARDDLVVQLIDYQGVGYRVVKDPVGLQYHRLQAEQYHVLRLLDGQRNLEEIRDDLRKHFPTLGLNLADVQYLITDLHQKGLVYSNRPGQAISLLKQRRKKRKEKLVKTFRSLLYLRLPGWDPEPTLQWLYPWFRWIFQPWAVGLAVALMVASWILLAVQFDQFRSRLPEFQQFFGWPNLMYLWVVLAVCKVIHEFGHGLSCHHFGGECHEMGLLFLVFSPCLYCDVTDSWMMRNKWHRIIIGGAGMYIEVVISALAIFVWWNTQPGLLHHLCLNTFFVTTVTTVIFNANPLLRFDGYYMMADWLEIPNLRPKADKLLREKFAWYCLGIESRPDPFMPETGIAGFVFFAVAAWLYRWVILFSITLFLYTVLKPYGLQSIGITLLVVSIGSIFINMGVNIYKVISAPRIEPMSKPKIATTVSVVVGLLVAALFIPLPWHVESAFMIEPHEVKHMYVITPGELQDLRVQPGQRVRQGDVLAVLTNFEKSDKHRALLVERAVQEKRIETYRALDDMGQVRVAEERLASIDEQLADFELQLAYLTIQAPRDGVVVAPARTPEPKLESAQNRLNAWYGTPLDPKNVGCSLEAGTHLLSIAPNDSLEAILLIDQEDRGDVRDNQVVEMKFEHLADRTFSGTISKIAENDSLYCPETLSNKYGGPLPTVSDPQGRERLMSAAYQATIVLEKDTELLKPGMRGRTRFIVNWRSSAEWIWRYLRRTFHFRL